MARRDYGLVKGYTPGGAVGKYRIVKFAATEDQVVLAAAATDGLIGVSTDIATASTDTRIDVVRSGIAPVYYGGTVNQGDWLTSDSNGAAVATTTDGARVIGIAEEDGVSGDIGSVLICPSKLSTPA